MELVDKVYETIEKAMCAYYTGDFTLTIDGNQWKLSLDLNQWKAPLVLVYEGDEEGFLNFLKKNLEIGNWIEQNIILEKWLLQVKEINI